MIFVVLKVFLKQDLFVFAHFPSQVVDCAYIVPSQFADSFGRVVHILQASLSARLLDGFQTDCLADSLARCLAGWLASRPDGR